LADYLGVKYVSLFCNGTIALQMANTAAKQVICLPNPGKGEVV
jgi:dTDP-4-amino-4,6-dideoxygalactose transaminase